MHRFHRSLAAVDILTAHGALGQTDPLASWNDGAAKRAAFVDAVTRQGAPDYLPPAERIAAFDNDGTLWPEQPIYVQLAFARARAAVPLLPDA